MTGRCLEEPARTGKASEEQQLQHEGISVNCALYTSKIIKSDSEGASGARAATPTRGRRQLAPPTPRIGRLIWCICVISNSTHFKRTWSPGPSASKSSTWGPTKCLQLKVNDPRERPQDLPSTLISLGSRSCRVKMDENDNDLELSQEQNVAIQDAH